MLNIGFSEILLISVLALVFIGPKELPVVLRHIFKWLRELEHFGKDMRKQFDEVINETGIPKTTTIIDLEGRKQVAYDIADLEKLQASKSTPNE